MRLPYLQVTQETFAGARMLAGLLGVGRHEASGLMLDLWAWAVDLGPKDEAPTGDCNGPLARTLLASAIEWRGDPAKLVDALEAIGLLEITDRGIRVRGLDRYAAAWEKAKKERARKAAWKSGLATSAGRDAEETRKERGRDAEREGKTQTQTQTQTQIEATTPPRPAGPVGGFRDDVDAAFRADRGVAFSWDSANETAVGALLGKGDPTEVLRRLRIGLARTRFPTINTLCDLNKHWMACAKPEATGPPGRAVDTRKAPVRAEDVNQAAFARTGDVTHEF